MRGGIRQDAEKKRSGASTIRRKRRRQGESGVVWTSGERDVASGRKKRYDVASGHKERCDASQDAQDARDARDAEYPALASGRNAGGSDARSVFADGKIHRTHHSVFGRTTSNAESEGRDFSYEMGLWDRDGSSWALELKSIGPHKQVSGSEKISEMMVAQMSPAVRKLAAISID